MLVRRRFMLAIGASALGAGPFALAQAPGKVWRVGFLSPRARPSSMDADYYGAFPRTLAELGYVEGRNLVIEWRFAEGDYYARLPGMAADLVRLKVDAILALGPPGALAAKAATTTIPIVFVVSSDPVATGLVASLARPGGNVTGHYNLAGDLSAKQLELLATVVPKLARVAVLVNPANPATAAAARNVEAAARRAKAAITTHSAATPAAVEQAFAAMAAARAGAVIVTLDPLFIQQVPQIADLALRHRLPSIFANREFAQAGGLMSYGQNQAEIYRRAAGYVDRILRGAKPADLPVEQPTKIELTLNARTARALGLVMPQSLLLAADSVIE